MRLEEAIKQTVPFASPQRKALVNLLFTANQVSADMKRLFKSHGLTMKQYNILRILNGASRPVCLAFIRERLLDRLSDVSRILDRMENGGLIVKTPSNMDKRLVDVQLSDKGSAMLEEVSAHQEELDAFMGPLTDADVEELNRLLDKIRSESTLTT